jgi:hypothetical protein
VVAFQWMCYHRQPSSKCPPGDTLRHQSSASHPGVGVDGEPSDASSHRFGKDGEAALLNWAPPHEGWLGVRVLGGDPVPALGADAFREVLQIPTGRFIELTLDSTAKLCVFVQRTRPVSSEGQSIHEQTDGGL